MGARLRKGVGCSTFPSEECEEGKHATRTSNDGAAEAIRSRRLLPQADLLQPGSLQEQRQLRGGGSAAGGRGRARARRALDERLAEST